MTVDIRNKDVYVPVGCHGNCKHNIVIDEEQIQKLVAKTKVLQPNYFYAFRQLACVGAFTYGTIALLSKLPWFLLPIGWVLCGFALSYLYVIGHDCAHDTWSSSKLLNNIIGELTFIPLLQPFSYFRMRHFVADKQVTITNKDKQNNSNQTYATYDYPSTLESLVKFRDQYLTNPLPEPLSYRLILSCVLTLTYAFTVLPYIYKNGGLFSVFKYVILPILVSNMVHPAVWFFVTQNIKAFIPSSISCCMASYNYSKLARELRREYPDTKGTTIEQSVRYWFHRIDWLHVIILGGTPMIALYGLMYIPCPTKTLIWTIVYYYATGMGITVGYHRLWSHKAYDANKYLQMFIMLLGSGALEGSILWWCGGHRVHHRYTDTEKDPYNAYEGFWYAHLGWMLVKPEKKTYSDIEDLKAQKFIRIQHDYYLYIGPFMAFIFPTLVAGLLWGDYVGGYFYAGALRLFCVHHSTFCVNSVAHYFGEHTYDDVRSPRDSIVTALLTFGEGYHNFHHEFPQDYRNGIRFYDYDPSKWAIKLFETLGLAWNLKTFPSNEILKGQVAMKEKKLQALKSLVKYAVPIETLPTMTTEQFKQAIDDGKQLTIIDELVHDIHEIIPNHPGGDIILKAVGKDATDHFYGRTKIYKHSNAASNFLSNTRIARYVKTSSADDKKQD